MQELTTTRHNELIDPFFHVWSWEIPVYLFLGGLVAGMMIIAGYFLYTGREKEANCACYKVPLFSLIFLSIGMLALFLDLEHKLYFWRLYTTFMIKSPMSWGAWILVLVYPVLILNFMLRLPDFLIIKFPALEILSKKIRYNPKAVRALGAFNIILGILLGVYTGVLLSSLGARPLWNSSILAVLFLISGLSSAAAFVHMIAKNKHESEMLAKADNTFLAIELFVIMLLLVGLLSSTEVHINAAQLLLTGDYAASFWVFVLGLGIVLPLIIQSLAVRHKVKHTAVAPMLVILGGLALRFVIVYAGQYSHYFNAQ